MANGEQDAAPTTSWMSDVQRALALLLIGILVIATGGLVVRLIVSASVDAVVDLAKIMLAALVNMALIALGFFFGNTLSKVQSDAGQQKVVEKLTSTAPAGAPGPVAPVAAAPTPDQLAEGMLSNGELAYFKALPDDESKKAFLAMSSAERQGQIAKV